MGHFLPWRSTFYHEKLPHHRDPDYAASKLTSIEINGTYYSTSDKRIANRVVVCVQRELLRHFRLIDNLSLAETICGNRGCWRHSQIQPRHRNRRRLRESTYQSSGTILIAAVSDMTAVTTGPSIPQRAEL